MTEVVVVYVMVWVFERLGRIRTDGHKRLRSRSTLPKFWLLDHFCFIFCILSIILVII